MTNVFSLLSNSSDKASLRASRTVSSLPLLSLAYVRRESTDDVHVDCLTHGRTADEGMREESNAVGRKSLEAAIVATRGERTGCKVRMVIGIQSKKATHQKQQISNGPDGGLL
jgi:hypothetical protein